MCPNQLDRLSRSLPHHTAQAYVDAYLEAARIGDDRRSPLFRSCEPGRRDALQDRAMSRLSALKMIKRRVRKVGAAGRDLRPQLPRHGDHRVPGRLREGAKYYDKRICTARAVAWNSILRPKLRLMPP